MRAKMISTLALSIAAAAAALTVAAAPQPKRDPAVVKNYLRAVIGDDVIKAVQKKEGGAAFVKAFFANQQWMEEFAGSGMFSDAPWKPIPPLVHNSKKWDRDKDGGTQGRSFKAGECSVENCEVCAAQKAFLALDLLVWNDKGDFITSTDLGRKIATALALNHGIDFSDEKLVQIMECYREWANDGTLHTDAVKNHDCRMWRQVVGFGQNAELSVENLRWSHNFANVDGDRYYGVCWQCAYRLWNCFGASVHGPMYYAPWAHRWNTEELRYRIGGVCGGLSKFGSHAAAAHGVRSFTAGQPGHCAYLLWDYPSDRWGIAYAVTAHTGPHDSLGTSGFAAFEESERYYREPSHWTGEYLRWKGEYEKAMRAAPGNFHAAAMWLQDLTNKQAQSEEWEKFAKAVRDTFKEAPAQGWRLYMRYLEHLKGRAERLEAAKLALTAMRENPAKTYENPYWDEIALNPLDKLFEKDDNAMWIVFDAALEGQAKTPTFYRQTINWGANRLMTDKDNSKRFLLVVGKHAKKSGEKLDYKGMILKASEMGDIAMFRQVYKLLDKLNPELKPKATGKGWPMEQYGGQLLSQDGILKTSSTSQWDNPICYRNVLDASDFDAGNGFHTSKGEDLWGMVVLAGETEIKGITVVNSGGSQNGGRQVPLTISISGDGGNWQELTTFSNVQDEWKFQLPSPTAAKYVKVGRKGEDKKEIPFHLKKILVYGRKLY